MQVLPTVADTAVVCEWKHPNGNAIIVTWNEKERLIVRLYTRDGHFSFAREALEGLAREITEETDIQALRGHFSTLVAMPRGSPGRYKGMVFSAYPGVVGSPVSEGDGHGFSSSPRPRCPASEVAGAAVAPPAGVVAVAVTGVGDPELHGPQLHNKKRLTELWKWIREWNAAHVTKPRSKDNQELSTQSERKALLPGGDIQQSSEVDPSIPGTGESDAHWSSLKKLWKSAQDINEAVTERSRKIPIVVGIALGANGVALFYAVNNPECSDRITLIAWHSIAGGCNFIAGILGLKYSLFRRVAHLKLTSEQVRDSDMKKPSDSASEESSQFCCILDKCSLLPTHARIVQGVALLVACEIAVLGRNKDDEKQVANERAQRIFQELSQVFSIWHVAGCFCLFTATVMNSLIAADSSNKLCAFNNSTADHSSRWSEENVSHELSHYTLVAAGVTILAFSLFFQDLLSRKKTVTVYL